MRRANVIPHAHRIVYSVHTQERARNTHTHIQICIYIYIIQTNANIVKTYLHDSRLDATERTALSHYQCSSLQ